MRSRYIQLIVRDNGAGLSRDLALLADTLRDNGCTVTIARLNNRARLSNRARRAWAWLRRIGRGLLHGREHTRYHLNLMIERISPALMRQAHQQVLIPNPEWFDPAWAAALARIDLVLAKTRHAESMFRELDCHTVWTGFTSRDRYLPDVPREQAFFHGPGRSTHKGTLRLLEVWRRHPEWPRLTMVWRRREPPLADLPDNIQLHRDYLTDEQLRQLQNAHQFHLCPSQTEGYGHYLVEAMSCGAVILTTDAEPMNELITAERGVLVAARANGGQGLAALYEIDSAVLEQAIERCIAMSAAERTALGGQARQWFEINQHGFAGRLMQALDLLESGAVKPGAGEGIDPSLARNG